MAMSRLVFVDEVGIDQFAEFAEEQRWNEVPDDDPDMDEDWETSLWQTADNTKVRFIDDAVVECQYADIDGDDASRAVLDHFTARDFPAALDDVDFSDPEDVVRQALRRLACVAPKTVDSRGMEIFDTAAQDSRRGVRLGALAIPLYAEWTECLPAVRRLADEDTDQGVRAIARSTRVMLEAAARE